jgi:hypothetical protein
VTGTEGLYWDPSGGTARLSPRGTLALLGEDRASRGGTARLSPRGGTDSLRSSGHEARPREARSPPSEARVLPPKAVPPEGSFREARAERSHPSGSEGPMLGNRPMSEWIARYSSSHQHPVNRLLHTLGIPLIVVSLVLGLLAVAAPGLLWLAGVLFVTGWVLQFVGHAIEGKPPEFFKDWRFLLVGLRWWMAKIAGKA